MQEIRWKEPEIRNEIEKQRALAERPQRMRNAALRWLAKTAIYALIVAALTALFVSADNSTPIHWGNFWFFALLFVVSDLLFGLDRAWQEVPNGADSCRVSKLGVTRMTAMQNFAWRDIKSYRFENCDAAPDLRVLIVEARKRKEPLRLYFEGAEREARLRDAMMQGLASTRRDGETKRRPRWKRFAGRNQKLSQKLKSDARVPSVRSD